jgi:hypothetical protein
LQFYLKADIPFITPVSYTIDILFVDAHWTSTKKNMEGIPISMFFRGNSMKKDKSVFFSTRIFLLDLSLMGSPRPQSVVVLSELKKTWRAHEQSFRMVVMTRGLCPGPTTTRTNSIPAREFCSGSAVESLGVASSPKSNERQARGGNGNDVRRCFVRRSSPGTTYVRI